VSLRKGRHTVLHITLYKISHVHIACIIKMEISFLCDPLFRILQYKCAERDTEMVGNIHQLEISSQNFCSSRNQPPPEHPVREVKTQIQYGANPDKKPRLVVSLNIMHAGEESSSLPFHFLLAPELPYINYQTHSTANFVFSGWREPW
jgi:hypothetical protein